jgi:hypothetical protein
MLTRSIIIRHLEPEGQDLRWCTGVSVGTGPLCLTLASCLAIALPPLDHLLLLVFLLWFPQFMSPSCTITTYLELSAQ